MIRVATDKREWMLTKGLRQCRVWLDEFPSLTMPPAEVRDYSYETTARTPAADRKAALELFIPLGARFLDGLLGAEFRSEPIGKLVVRVSTSAEAGAPLPWSLAAAIDDVRTGLPPEYIAGLLQGVERANQAQTLGEGILEITVAAHGAQGSSQSQPQIPPAVGRSRPVMESLVQRRGAGGRPPAPQAVDKNG